MISKTKEEETKLKFKMINSIIKRLSKELMGLKVYTDKLNTEIGKKVNLESETLDSELSKDYILTGVISANGINVTGTNTVFTKELTQGFKLNISNESKTIVSVIDDTHATVEANGFSIFSNQLATITKPVTREELIGSFDFGNLSSPFNGVINKGSSLKHYGNMVDIADIVNVGYVLKSTNAALQRAAQAIQRDGDTVGDDNSDQLDYLFQNVKCIFDDFSILKYRGQYAEDDDIVTKGVIDDLKLYVDKYQDDTFYANWTESNQNQMRAVTTGGIQHYTQLGLTPSEKTDGLDNYFTVTTNGLVCKKECIILVTINAWMDNTDARGGGTGLSLYFAKNDTIISKLQTISAIDNGNSWASFAPCVSGSYMIKCLPSDIIKAGPAYYGNTSNLHATTSIAKMR